MTRDLLDQYWFPIGHVSEFSNGKIHRRQLNSTPLVVAQADKEWIVAPEACPHRGASLAEGYVEGTSFICPYHGRSVSCGKVRALGSSFETSIYTRVAGDLLFICAAEKVPDFPYFNVLRYVDCGRASYKARFAEVECNWQLAVENTLDPAHLEFLHAKGRVARGVSTPDQSQARNQHFLSFEETEMGIVKRRRFRDQTDDEEDWRIGQHFFFPAVFSISSPEFIELHFRTPVNESSTLYIWYRVDKERKSKNIWRNCNIRRINGFIQPDDLDSEDLMVLESQQRMSSHQCDKLFSEDKGIVLFRSILNREEEKFRNGGLSKMITYTGQDIDVVVPVRRETVKVVEDLNVKP